MKKKSNHGFTIVELVIVIAVIGILAAVLIPTFSGIIDKAKLSAEIQLETNLRLSLSDILFPIYSEDSCPHENLFFLEYGDVDCVACMDCGLTGSHVTVETLSLPTTISGGELRYHFHHRGDLMELNRTIDQLPHIDWEWAFYNDEDHDGVPELQLLHYNDSVTVTQQYFYQLTDFDDIPKTLDQYIEQVKDDADFMSLIQNEQAGQEDQARIQEAIEEEAQRRLTEANTAFKTTHGFSADRIENNINTDKTQPRTYNRNLYYYLHVPFDYDSNKSYPVLVFSPGAGGYIAGHLDDEGNLKANEEPQIYDWEWSKDFFNNWYEQTKNPGAGRDAYDCFLIFLQPYDMSAWHGNGTNLICTDTAAKVDTWSEAYYVDKEGSKKKTALTSGEYTAEFNSTFDSNELTENPEGQLVCKLIDELAQTYSINLKRQYIAGGSLGGAFTIDTICHNPDRFACAVPVVPQTVDLSSQSATNLAESGMNIWAFSGENDTKCNPYFVMLFTKGITQKSGHGTIQYSIMQAESEATEEHGILCGHECYYIGAHPFTAKEGGISSSGTAVLDFIFHSSK